MPDRIGQGDQRRGADRADARVYVCRGPACCRKSVEGRRPGHRRADETILSRNARARSVEPGRGVTSSPVVDLERETVARALLLGGLRPAWRVEIAMSVSNSQRKGWVITREAFDRMLAELHPDIERAGEQYEKIRQKLVKLFEWRGCLNAEECADETFNRVAQKICEGTSIWTDDPYSYFHGVALNVLREYLRSAEQTAKTLQEVAQIQDTSVDPEDLLLRETEQREKEHLLECLTRCLQKLSTKSLH